MWHGGRHSEKHTHQTGREIELEFYKNEKKIQAQNEYHILFCFVLNIFTRVIHVNDHLFWTQKEWNIDMLYCVCVCIYIQRTHTHSSMHSMCAYMNVFVSYLICISIPLKRDIHTVFFSFLFFFVFFFSSGMQSWSTWLQSFRFFFLLFSKLNKRTKALHKNFKSLERICAWEHTSDSLSFHTVLVQKSVHAYKYTYPHTLADALNG